MKKKRVTYGVIGMMEYQAVIKMGRSVLKVHFADGSMNAMGVNPAKYTTENAMVQHAIEQSEQYRCGLIRTVRTVELDEEVQIERGPSRLDATRRQTEPEAGPEAGSQEAGPEAGTQEAEPGGKMIEMEFDNNDDAKDFLEAQFGYVRSKLHNRAEIIAAGKANGIAIIFT